MNAGDQVTRNPKYNFCICGLRQACWCKGQGDWQIADVKTQRSSQSGMMVIAVLGENKTDWIDSSYFIRKIQGELFA